MTSPSDKNSVGNTNLLPGLGDLDDTYKNTENLSSWSRGSLIPVIGSGCNSLIKSEVANDATPTLDELQTDNKITSRDDSAFNFLSNIMEQVKTKPQTKPIWTDHKIPPLPSPFETITNLSATNQQQQQPAVNQWNEKNESTAWLAAYSPPPHQSPNWKPTSPPLPPPPPDKTKVSESVKPPIPPGPEPPSTGRSRNESITTNLITLSNQSDFKYFTSSQDRDMRMTSEKQQPIREVNLYEKKFSNLDEYSRHNYFESKPPNQVDRVNRRPPPHLFSPPDHEPKRFRPHNDFRPRPHSRFPPRPINHSPNFRFERFPRFSPRKRYFPVDQNHRGSYKMHDV